MLWVTALSLAEQHDQLDGLLDHSQSWQRQTLTCGTKENLLETYPLEVPSLINEFDVKF